MDHDRRVFRNDWSSLPVPDLGRWQPSLRVSVVIPAHNTQPSLDVLLAALARQTYPAELFDVLVVDDGSQPRLQLPAARPASTRLLRTSDHESRWGISAACNLGITQSTGEIVLRLDSDMVPFPHHIEAHARWHHAIDYAVTLGFKRFVDVSPGDPAYPVPMELTSDAAVEDLFDVDATRPHAYVEEIIRRTDGLRFADHLAFRAHVGATVAMRRVMIDRVGGFDEELKRGEDTELGFRLAQAGAVFVPEPAARAWHLGLSGMMRHDGELRRYTRPRLADRMPQPRWLRQVGGTQWAVPLVTAVVDADGAPMEAVRDTVDAILRSSERDVQVHIVGAWDHLGDEPRAVLDDPDLDLRLVAAMYRSDARVNLVPRAPGAPFPSPYLLVVPAGIVIGPQTIGRLVDECDGRRSGLVRVATGRQGAAVELWRTAALVRAEWIGRQGEPLEQLVAQTHGICELPARQVGMGGGTGGWRSHGVIWSAQTIEVGGVRSWLRATAALPVMALRRVRPRWFDRRRR